MKQAFKNVANSIIEVVYHMVNSKNYLEEEWLKLPTLSEYLAKNPKCQTENPEKVMCYSCGSADTIMQPLKNVRTRKNTHFCMDCKRKLFRSEDLV